MTPAQQFQLVNQPAQTGEISGTTLALTGVTLLAMQAGMIYVGWKVAKWPGVAGAILIPMVLQKV